MTKESLLVTLADKSFVEQAKQLFSSVYWNAGWKGDYMLLAHNIPEDNLKWFFNKKILVKKIESIDNRFVGDSKYNPAVLDKFYLFTEEFKKWKYVVFLDADIIVRASLERLTGISTFSCVKIVNRNFRCYFSEKESEKIKELKDEFNLRRSAFNSGVMAFNTDIIKYDTFDRLVSLYNKYCDVINGDDSILNLYFYNIWEKAPLIYNLRVNHFHCKKLDAIVLHFERAFRKIKDNDKPWMEGNTYREEWEKNLLNAENIDLGKPIAGIQYSNCRMAYLTFVLRLLMSFKHLVSFCKIIIGFPEMILGKIGIIIKKINPALYSKLKRNNNGE
ncbi:MAG TPA: glycosyltransferase [Bacteroidales bacterium]|nr:glycosyltransferase [Bacteroidales bacterium]